jgi:hypothetical protein
VEGVYQETRRRGVTESRSFCCGERVMPILYNGMRRGHTLDGMVRGGAESFHNKGLNLTPCTVLVFTV